MLPHLILLFLTITFPIFCSAAEFQYSIRDGGFAIRNGPGYFNRPLFGTHEVTMLLSGDRPAFAYFAPTDIGKIGTLYLGLVSARGSKWLHHFAEIESLYQPGLTRHVVQDPAFAGGSLEVTAVPLSRAEGFTLRLRWIKHPSEKVRLVWTFGGASGYDRHYSSRIDKLHLSESDSDQNQIHVWGNRFSLTSPTMKGKKIQGTCDLPGRLQTKNTKEIVAGPAEADLAAASKTTVFASNKDFYLGAGQLSSLKTPIAVFSGDWAGDSVHLVFTMGDTETLEELARNPSETYTQSVDFYRNLAKRVQVNTPDPFFNLAVESMVVANDGLWRPPAILHGAMSWPVHYLGWRGMYGPQAFGWHDRVRSNIVAHAARQSQRGDNRGALPNMLEDTRMFVFNMNEVYLDHIYYHYLWTGDRDLLSSLLPVIRGILVWEKRRLDPDDNALYENCLNTWISDSHWYSGGDSTQASAYMYRGHLLAAEAAEAAGEDRTPYQQEADRIRKAMNDKLWIGAKGHYAEFIDRIGLKRIHAEPELPTIYHPIEFGVTDQFQAYQMLRFTEVQLRNETNLPNGGRLVWSSNWAPNHNKNYTHSTYDLVYAEVLNLAIAYYRAGQLDKAYELVKGVYAGMYMGGIPGGLSCSPYRNGQQRAHEEFGDAIGLFARTAVEGVFGILPEMQRGLIHLSPGFPTDWKDASIQTPDLAYHFRKTNTEINLEVSAVRPVRIHYRVPVHDARVLEVLIDGSPADARVEPNIGGSFVDVSGSHGNRSHLRIRFERTQMKTHFQSIVVPGENWTIHTEGGRLRELKDPQLVLSQTILRQNSLSATIGGAVGHHTLFVLVGEGRDSHWEPINIEVRPSLEIVNTEPDFSANVCHFVLRNNTTREVRANVKAHWTGKSTDLAISLASGTERRFRAEGGVSGAFLGKNTLEITGFANESRLSSDVRYWPQHAPAKQQGWRLLRLDPLLNDSLSEVLFHRFWTAEYSYSVCCDYMVDHLVGYRSKLPDDRRLRAGVNEKGVFVTQVGIPFAQRREGNNIVALSRWKEFPDHVEIPVNDFARKIYLLISGVTFPMQSHIANASVLIHYADGGKSTIDLVNPDNFDNGWGGFGGNYHYATNGMEVIADKPPQAADAERAAAQPVTILGQHGIPDPNEGQKAPQVLGATEAPSHADIVDLDCDPTRRIRSVEVKVLSNEIILGLLGVTLLK